LNRFHGISVFIRISKSAIGNVFPNQNPLVLAVIEPETAWMYSGVAKVGCGNGVRFQPLPVGDAE
jgi:hypothetical protein